ncbi:uncharacterized protein [Littorina saxatilis]|uniref:uncharacterized protein n=1 Tax=Littorina saxatilis TaxID=31220 RepID=UPI0038B5810F
MGVIRSGFRLPWQEGKAPLSRAPANFRFPASLDAREAIQAEILLLLQKQAVEEVLDHSSLGFYGRIFVVPKASGGWRPVLDLSPLNRFLRKIRFTMETPATVREALRPGDWVTSVDLTDAYFHILMHEADRKWLRFLWGDRIFQFRALPFGLSLAPWGTHVLIHTDNTTVAAYLNKQGGSRSQLLSSRACEILSWCARHQILVSARYLPGCLNVLADALSRSSQILHTEWTIAHQALLRLWAQVERPMVDLFATRFSRRLPIFVSPFPDPEAWKIDAMTISWTGLVAYAFPPTPLIGRVLRKADLERPRLLLVAPRWPSQHWFPDLLRLASGPPIPLSLRRGELLQPRTGILHDRPEFLDLHAWRLFGDH